MTDWIEWHGGEQPVADEVVVGVKLRNGYSEYPVAAGGLRWIHLNSGGDIIAYRIVSQPSELDRLRKENAALREALEAIDKECFSHIDGRDLFAQMHPRHTLDIKRRIDARETWYEGDWLSDLWGAIKKARAALQGATYPAAQEVDQ